MEHKNIIFRRHSGCPGLAGSVASLPATATCTLYFYTLYSFPPQNLSSSCAGENPTNVCPSAVRSTFTRTSASVSEPDFRSVAIVLNASEYTRVTR
jgi:hypothetical protein